MGDNTSWNDINIDKITKMLESKRGNVVLGIDGFIDQVWQVLDKRINESDCLSISKMEEFGQMIVDRAQGGLAKEIVEKRRTYGGFTGNTGITLGNLGVQTNIIGFFGKPELDPVFLDLSKKTNLISVGTPASCNILEFDDGKIMLSNLTETKGFDWMNSLSDIRNLKDILDTADVVGMGYWANMPYFDDLIKYLTDNYFTSKSNRRLFLDFANINKKSGEQLKKTLDLLGEINLRTSVTLSLNKHEATLLCYQLGIHGEINGILNVYQKSDLILELQNKIRLDEIIIHAKDYAIYIGEETSGIEQVRCEVPVRTTGAGDTFNGGYIAACVWGLNVSDRMAIASACAHFYVKNGFPPNRDELMNELIMLCATTKQKS